MSRIINRREFIRAGSVGISALSLAGPRCLATGNPQPEPKAKAIIQLWMAGGPSHLDTFDPKPQAGQDYCGPYNKPIATNVDGVRICQKLPKLAMQADKYSIIRSMTHGVNAHETSTYIIQTGTMPTEGLVYPSIGAVVAYKKAFKAGYSGSIPPYITITSALGRFSEEGFLGPKYKPFATGGDPNAKVFAVQGLVPTGSVTLQRLKKRRELLKSINSYSSNQNGSIEPYQTMDSYQQQAYELILGDAKKAFDISQEPEKLRERYGRNRFGQSCLLARRLIEHGVKFITVNFGGWDTHKKNFEKLDKMLPQLDSGFATLLEDLAQRGLLESTIVVWYGEFGRKPLISKDPPWNYGRGHHGAAFSAVVAGGGFKGGTAVGATDFKGEKVRKRPVYPWDLSASIYQLVGIDPAGKLPHPHGCVAYVSPASTGSVHSGGLLKEIM